MAPVTRKEFEGSDVPEVTLNVGLDAFREIQDTSIDPLSIVQKCVFVPMESALRGASDIIIEKDHH